MNVEFVAFNEQGHRGVENVGRTFVAHHREVAYNVGPMLLPRSEGSSERQTC